MPIHDWRRVTAGTFHHFHQEWISEIGRALNGGLLPAGYYALTDQVAGGPHPDVLMLEEVEEGDDEYSDGYGDEPSFGFGGGGAAVVSAIADHPPKLRYTLEAEEAIYASKADRVAIYHSTGDRVIAFIEIVSPGNKHSGVAVRQLIDKLANALAQGCHVILIDLFPPGPNDPQGLHAKLWGKADPPMTDDEPFTLVSYRASASPVAHLEPMAVGETLVDVPLFLDQQHYINVPLEATYLAAWTGLPDRWKKVLAPPLQPVEIETTEVRKP